MKPYWKRHSQRTQAQSLARDLARSGVHANHHSIVAELTLVHGIVKAPEWLALIAGQLDKLCALAQASPDGTQDRPLQLAEWLCRIRQMGSATRLTAHVTPSRE